MVTHIEKIRCKRLAAAKEAGRSESADEAYGYLSRLLVYLHPDIHLLDDLMGVCTQIDHEIASLRAESARLRRNSLEQAIQTEDGWDGYDGVPTTRAAIDTARRYAWVPLAYGGLLFEAGGDLPGIEIDADGNATPDDDLWGENERLREALDIADKLVGMLDKAHELDWNEDRNSSWRAVMMARYQDTRAALNKGGE